MSAPALWHPPEGEPYERCSVCHCELAIPPLDLDIQANLPGRKCRHCAELHKPWTVERYMKVAERKRDGGC